MHTWPYYSGGWWIVWNRRHACALCYLAGECIYGCSDVFDEFTDELAALCTIVVNSFPYLACFCCGYSGKGRCMERHPVWLFVFGPGPVFLLVCFLGDETQVWLGDLRVVLLFVVALFGCDLDCPLFWCWPTVLSTLFLTAYVSIRTVPQSIYGQTRGKKKPSLAWPRLASPRPRRASKRFDCRLAST